MICRSGNEALPKSCKITRFFFLSNSLEKKKGNLLAPPSTSVILEPSLTSQKAGRKQVQIAKEKSGQGFALFPFSPRIFSPTDCAVKYKPAATHSSESLPGRSSFILDLSRECKEGTVSQNLFTPEFLQLLRLDIVISKTRKN